MKIITYCVLDTETLEWIPELEESFEYCGEVAKMCGPSAQENTAQAAESSFQNQLMGSYATNFANQQQVLSELNAASAPIIAAGPNQQGMNAAELANLNTTAINQAGAANRNAVQAIQSRVGAGSPSGLPTGVDEQLLTSVESQQAGNLANAELGIQNENYQLGREQYGAAIAGANALASLYNPQSYASPANQANQQNFGEANTINQQQNQETADIAGAGVGLGMDALTFGAGAVAGAGPAGLSPLQSGLFSLAGGGLQ